MNGVKAGTSGALYLISIIVLLLSAACTSEETIPPTTTEQPSLEQIPIGIAAYELKVTSAGDSLRQSLVQPVPLRSLRRFEVLIEEPSSWVSAVLEISVERSSADGSSDTLIITGVTFSASDPAMANELISNEGAVLQVVRGPNRVVEEYAPIVNEAGVALDAISVSVGSFWVGQLLRTPVAFGGPIPVDPVGQGAIWEVTFQDEDASQTAELHTLLQLDLDRYVIEARPLGEGTDLDGRPLSVLLEGQVGQVLPDRQEIVTGDLTITVAAIS